MHPALILFSLACGEDACPAGSARRDDGLCVLIAAARPTPSTATTAPADVPALETPVPAEQWTGEEAGAAIDQALAMGLPDPFTLRQSWFDLWEGADPICPGANYSFVFGLDGCTSDLGWTYSGPASYMDMGEGGFELGADGYALRPDGSLFQGGGMVMWRPDGSQWDLLFSGTWSDSAAEGWLGAGVTTALEFNGSTAGDAPSVIITGAMRVADAPSIYTQRLTVGGGCANAASGDLWVRDPAGRWYGLTLDCDACGDVRMPDGSDDQACIDLSPLQAATGWWSE